MTIRKISIVSRLYGSVETRCTKRLTDVLGYGCDRRSPYRQYKTEGVRDLSSMNGEKDENKPFFFKEGSRLNQ